MPSRRGAGMSNSHSVCHACASLGMPPRVRCSRINSPMRIVHVITRLIVGGAQENTLYNCEDLIERHGDDVTLITGPAEGPEGDLIDRARRNIPDVVVMPELKRAVDPWTDRVCYRRLKEEIAERKPAVVHTH